MSVRSRKRGKARRLPLHPDAQRILQRYLSDVRCPSGILPIVSEQEHEPLLVGMQVTIAKRPLVPGIKTRIVRKRIADLGRRAANRLREAAKRERNGERAENLKTLTQQLDTVSPHMCCVIAWPNACSTMAHSFLKFDESWVRLDSRPQASISPSARTIYGLLLGGQGYRSREGKKRQSRLN